MKFEGVDTQLNSDVIVTGEMDDDGTIKSITWSDDVWEAEYNRSVVRYGPITKVDDLNRRMPRIMIGAREETESGNVVKLRPEKKQVFGWAYVSHDPEGTVQVDHSGEFIEDVSVLEDAAYKFVVNSRKGGVDHQREEDDVIVKSTMIESIVFTPDKIKELGIPAGSIPQGAWWVGYQIHDDEVWNRFQRGELTSFSIHGSGVKKKVDE